MPRTPSFDSFFDPDNNLPDSIPPTEPPWPTGLLDYYPDVDWLAYLWREMNALAPNPVIILAAGFIELALGNDNTPTWVTMLAGANPNTMRLACDTIIEMEKLNLNNLHDLTVKGVDDGTSDSNSIE